MQRAEFDPRHVAQPHDRAVLRVGAHDNLAELGGIAQTAEGIDLHFECRAFRRRRLADLAGRDLHVLLRDGVAHVKRRDVEIGELVRIEPDAHRIAPLAENLHVADARQALERIDDLEVGVVAERDRIPPTYSGEVRFTISTKFGFCFLMVTPA